MFFSLLLLCFSWFFLFLAVFIFLCRAFILARFFFLAFVVVALRFFSFRVVVCVFWPPPIALIFFVHLLFWGVLPPATGFEKTHPEAYEDKCVPKIEDSYAKKDDAGLGVPMMSKSEDNGKAQSVPSENGASASRVPVEDKGVEHVSADPACDAGEDDESVPRTSNETQKDGWEVLVPNTGYSDFVSVTSGISKKNPNFCPRGAH